MTPARQTIIAISRMWNEAIRREDSLPLWLLGDLIDDFRLRSGTAEEKLALVNEAPEWIHSELHADGNAYLAAVAETLCREVSLTPPAWTESPCCYLHRPWFAGGLETLKAILLVESPVPFRRRNLFVSANALARA